VPPQHFPVNLNKDLKNMKDLPECIERAGEVWVSCMLLMVQGQVLELTTSHAITAAKVSTGVVLTYFVAKKLLGIKKFWKTIVLLAAITAAIDFLVHPTHFGEAWTEAVVTGIGASLFATIGHYIATRHPWASKS
jgi:hypothetical protein